MSWGLFAHYLWVDDWEYVRGWTQSSQTLGMSHLLSQSRSGPVESSLKTWMQKMNKPVLISCEIHKKLPYKNHRFLCHHTWDTEQFTSTINCVPPIRMDYRGYPPPPHRWSTTCRWCHPVASLSALSVAHSAKASGSHWGEVTFLTIYWKMCLQTRDCTHKTCCMLGIITKPVNIENHFFLNISQKLCFTSLNPISLSHMLWQQNMFMNPKTLKIIFLSKHFHQ